MSNHVQRMVERAFVNKCERGWQKLYWAIDIHDVLIEGKYQRLNPGKQLFPRVEEVLHWLMKRPDMVTILWSSSHKDAVDDFLGWLLSEHGIEFDYVNCNPECINNDLCDFSKKFYFNLLIDDKAGFDPSADWSNLISALENLGQWGDVPDPFNTSLEFKARAARHFDKDEIVSMVEAPKFDVPTLLSIEGIALGDHDEIKAKFAGPKNGRRVERTIPFADLKIAINAPVRKGLVSA